MIQFTSAPGNLFNRIGAIAAVWAQLRSYQASQKTNLIDTALGITAQFNSEPDLQALIGDNYISLLNSSGSIVATLQQLAQATFDRVVFRDNPRFNQNLTQQSPQASIIEVIRQMKVEGATILAMTITATPQTVSNPGPHFTGTGNGIINVAVKRPLDGVVLENSYTETLLFTVTADSYSGGATAGNEPITVTGQGSDDLFAFDWPLGSNASASINAIDGDVSVGSGNILTNSGFNSFLNTQNVPDNFTLDVGAAGTNVFRETSITYSGGAALKITGDGATLVQLRQQFNAATGTTGVLTPITQYSFNVFIRNDAVAAGAGQLNFELVDGNGNVINDMNGVPNTFTVNLTTLTPVYTSFTGIFRTPEQLPAQAYLRIRMPTGNALSNGRSVYLDKASMGLMTQMAPQCPFVASHSGSIPFAVNDFAQATVTNSRGAGGTLSTFQTSLYILLNSIVGGQNEILFPSSSVPTISDSLI